LRAKIDAALRPLIPANSPVALLDFPNHPNVGDSAIWLGEVQWLQANGSKRLYVCDVDTYNSDVLRSRCPDGPILLHGGGNFGDLWPRYQRLRETVVRDFPDRPIVQLPQTVYFKDPRELDRSRQYFNAHRDFTLFVRDRRSYDAAVAAFRSRVILCPDTAFVLDLKRASATATKPLVYLRRSDQEAAASRAFALPTNALVADWLDESPMVSTMAKAFRRLLTRYPSRVAPLAPAFADALARTRVNRGVRLLSKGERVVTDRLHAHILCVLLGIPHTVIDNSYGKLSSFIEAWTSGTCEMA
jgi:pyruvyl transferase EpsO